MVPHRCTDVFQVFFDFFLIRWIKHIGVYWFAHPIRDGGGIRILHERHILYHRQRAMVSRCIEPPILEIGDDLGGQIHPVPAVLCLKERLLFSFKICPGMNNPSEKKGLPWGSIRQSLLP
jgi:hypothetical protein